MGSPLSCSGICGFDCAVECSIPRFSTEFKLVRDILEGMTRRIHRRISYFTSSLLLVIGLVLIWRGVWYVLDWLDITFLGGSHVFSAVGGIVLGFLILYLPDRDLKEIRKL